MWHSALAMVARLRAGQSGARIPAAAKIYLIFKTFRWAMEPTQPSVQLTTGVKRPDHEARPLTSIEQRD